ncbi:MAG: hypothetical protein QOK15_2867 [Nocardioidaceae bacterium]|nr:hypothetical protein [Nocardioidaceae bacterium]
MGRTLRRWITITAVLLAVLTTEGCHVTKDSSGHQEACTAQTLDLRHPPTREQLGFAAGANTATSACDAGFALHVDLPHGTAFDLDVTQMVADSLRSEQPTSGQPTTVAITSTSDGVATTAGRAVELARTLQMDPTEISAWRRTATATPDSTDDTTTPFIRSTLGYVLAELQVVRLSGSDNCYVSLILSWGH